MKPLVNWWLSSTTCTCVKNNGRKGKKTFYICLIKEETQLFYLTDNNNFTRTNNLNLFYNK